MWGMSVFALGKSSISLCIYLALSVCLSICIHFVLSICFSPSLALSISPSRSVSLPVSICLLASLFIHGSASLYLSVYPSSLLVCISVLSISVPIGMWHSVFLSNSLAFASLESFFLQGLYVCEFLRIYWRRMWRLQGMYRPCRETASFFFFFLPVSVVLSP